MYGRVRPNKCRVCVGRLGRSSCLGEGSIIYASCWVIEAGYIGAFGLPEATFVPFFDKLQTRGVWGKEYIAARPEGLETLTLLVQICDSDRTTLIARGGPRASSASMMGPAVQPGTVSARKTRREKNAGGTISVALVKWVRPMLGPCQPPPTHCPMVRLAVSRGHDGVCALTAFFPL